MKKALQWFFGTGFVLVVIGIGMLVACAVSGSSHKQYLDQMDIRIADLKTRSHTMQEQFRVKGQDRNEDVTGMDAERVHTDDGVAEVFLKKALTWDTLEEYEANRQQVMGDYGLEETDGFMTTFLPNIAVVTDADGNTYQRDPVHAVKVSYRDMSSRVVRIAGDTYSYFTEVTVSVEDPDREGSDGTALCIFEYTVDRAGNLSDLSGYTVVEVQD